MGCDHLEVARFKKSMGNLQDNHSRIADIYRKKLFDVYNKMKEAWNTPKGWEQLNELATKMHMRMSSMSKIVEHNYYVMEMSGNDWARSQYVVTPLVQVMLPIRYEKYEVGKHEGEINIVKEEACFTAVEEYRQVLDEINECMNNMQIVTSNDEEFGYYSTDGENPREAINRCISKERDSIAEDFIRYSLTMRQEIEEDKKARENAKKITPKDNPGPIY